MNESLMIANVYAAYTASSSKSDKNVSDLSKMLKSNNNYAVKSTAKDNAKENDSAIRYTDKVIISKEALERLNARNTDAN